MLNRSAILVSPKQPYIDWAAQLDDSNVLPTVDGERTVYLLPAYEDEDQALQLLKAAYGMIFESELMGWHLLESGWPRDRSYDVFQQWFDVEFQSIVEDLGSDPLADED